MPRQTTSWCGSGMGASRRTRSRADPLAARACPRPGSLPSRALMRAYMSGAASYDHFSVAHGGEGARHYIHRSGVSLALTSLQNRYIAYQRQGASHAPVDVQRFPVRARSAHAMLPAMPISQPMPGQAVEDADQHCGYEQQQALIAVVAQKARFRSAPAGVLSAAGRGSRGSRGSGSRARRRRSSRRTCRGGCRRMYMCRRRGALSRAARISAPRAGAWRCRWRRFWRFSGAFSPFSAVPSAFTGVSQAGQFSAQSGT